MNKYFALLFTVFLVAPISGMIVAGATEAEKQQLKSAIAEQYRQKAHKELHPDINEYMDKFPDSEKAHVVKQLIEGTIEDINYTLDSFGVVSLPKIFHRMFNEEFQALKNQMRAELGKPSLTIDEEKRWITLQKREEYVKQVKEHLGSTLAAYVYDKHPDDTDSKVMQNFIRLARFDAAEQYINPGMSGMELDVVKLLESAHNCIGPRRLNFIKTGDQADGLELYPFPIADQQARNEAKVLYEHTVKRLKEKTQVE